ncbi:hypothetical protein [Allonocardiopsis opalescens]|uniref:Uncharacterized protein n=1 Tax=Allonocardiopsis opalescens TaxID=1144618 RepID=A0A2T0PZ99_9ACTN|nr:hypothetical protein [Allonocardiopsis opalescens]PRX96851.1 hypothetical protein CLV72_107374 [Allonocardiopsis opalescens]
MRETRGAPRRIRLPGVLAAPAAFVLTLLTAAWWVADFLLADSGPFRALRIRSERGFGPDGRPLLVLRISNRTLQRTTVTDFGLCERRRPLRGTPRWERTAAELTWHGERPLPWELSGWETEECTVDLGPDGTGPGADLLAESRCYVRGSYGTFRGDAEGFPPLRRGSYGWWRRRLGG